MTEMMLNKSDLYPLAQETMAAISVHYTPAMQQAREAAGLDRTDWGPVFMAFGADPRPVDSRYIQQQAPYLSLAAAETRLAGSAGRGFLEPVADGSYRLTEQGRDVVRQTLEAAWAEMEKLEPLPRDELNRLADLLERVVNALATAPEPASKQHLADSRKVDPGRAAAPVVRIDQYLTDMAFYRDDVHPPAWQSYGVDGPIWEIFTTIWREDANTPDSLQQHLEGRQHAPEVFAQAVQELSAREWIAVQDGTYRVTERGAALRQEAEDTTDRLFYAPWSCLTESETTKIRDSLAQLRDRLRPAGDEHTG